MRLAEGACFHTATCLRSKTVRNERNYNRGLERGSMGSVGPSISPDVARLALLEIPTAFDRLEQRHFVGILDIHPDRNAIGDTRDPGPERFQLVR